MKAQRLDTVSELVDLGRWIAGTFGLSGRPKVHEQTEAEKIHAEIVRRIAERTHGKEEPEAKP